MEEKKKEEDLPQMILFHETTTQKRVNEAVFSLFLLRSFSIEGMEFLDGVYMKEDVMVVAGVSNSSK